MKQGDKGRKTHYERERPRHLLVDIDMLFDLRLALLEQIDENKAIDLIHEGTYYSRESDKVLRERIGMKREEWYGRLRGDGERLIKNSLATALVSNLFPLVNNRDEIRTLGFNGDFHLTINFPDFVLPQEDLDELREVINEVTLGAFSEIKFSHYPLEKLNTVFLLTYYSDYFCYQWHKWVEIHYEQCKDTLTPTLRIWCPQLIADVDEEITKEDKEFLGEINLFDLITYGCIHSFYLEWVDKREAMFYIDDGIDDNHM